MNKVLKMKIMSLLFIEYEKAYFQIIWFKMLELTHSGSNWTILVHDDMSHHGMSHQCESSI